MNQSCFYQKGRMALLKTILSFAIVSLTVMPVFAAFNSGSNGSDGPLNITTQGTVIFDPKAMGLDTDSDNVFNFTTITISQGTTVRLGADKLGNRAVYWLASGKVIINGALDLNGQTGHDANLQHVASIAGAGGYCGGMGLLVGGTLATPGEGPGGGGVSPSAGSDANGVSASYRNLPTDACTDTINCGKMGPTYGNKYLLPLLGGSGGSGAGNIRMNVNAPGGGAGGGAICIASSDTMIINGTISANGGNGYQSYAGYFGGGGGSGGAVRLVANRIEGSGSINVNGGGHGLQYIFGGNRYSSPGYIRLEAFSCSIPLSSLHPYGIIATPGLQLFPTPGSLPSVKIVSIDGVVVPSNPSGTYSMPDLTINKSDSSIIAIQANNIPVGTAVHLAMNSENEGSFSFVSTPLTGTQISSTATATVKIPPGFSRFSLKASW